MDRVKKSNGVELMKYYEYLNQVKKVQEVQSSFVRGSDQTYQKVKSELQYEHQRLKHQRAKQIEEENQKFYGKLTTVLNKNNLKLRQDAGPSSLNIVQRRQNISKINQENDVFINKLKNTKPTILSGRSLEKRQENMDSYKNIASLYPHGKKRLDPLIDKQIQSIMSTSKLRSERISSVRTLDMSLPSIHVRDNGLNLDDILKQNQSFEYSSKNPSPPAEKMNYPTTMIFDDNNDLLTKRPNFYKITLKASSKRSISVQRQPGSNKSQEQSFHELQLPRQLQIKSQFKQNSIDANINLKTISAQEKAQVDKEIEQEYVVVPIKRISEQYKEAKDYLSKIESQNTESNQNQ